MNTRSAAQLQKTLIDFVLGGLGTLLVVAGRVIYWRACVWIPAGKNFVYISTDCVEARMHY